MNNCTMTMEVTSQSGNDDLLGAPSLAPVRSFCSSTSSSCDSFAPPSSPTSKASALHRSSHDLLAPSLSSSSSSLSSSRRSKRTLLAKSGGLTSRSSKGSTMDLSRSFNESMLRSASSKDSIAAHDDETQSFAEFSATQVDLALNETAMRFIRLLLLLQAVELCARRVFDLVLDALQGLCELFDDNKLKQLPSHEVLHSEEAADLKTSDSGVDVWGQFADFEDELHSGNSLNSMLQTKSKSLQTLQEGIDEDEEDSEDDGHFF